MKKYIIFIVLLTSIVSGNAQMYSATIAIDNVDVSKLTPGEKVAVPVRLVEKTGGLISEIQFFIEFDHSVFVWNGTFEEPAKGIENCHPNMPWDNKNWMLNDNGNQLVVLWGEPAFKGVEIKNGKAFCEFIFIYKGLNANSKECFFSWGDEYEDINGRLVRGATEMLSEIPDLFTLTMINAKVKIK